MPDDVVKPDYRLPLPPLRVLDEDAEARAYALEHGISIQHALEQVRPGIAKRTAAARRIRAIHEQVRATLAAREAEGQAGQESHGGESEEGSS